MGKIFPVLGFLVVVVILAPIISHADEPLFDTKAATRHIEKGFTHLQQKNYDSAVKEFEEAATIAPDAEAFYYLGYAFYMKGKTHNDPQSRKKSIENFDRAYELNPNFSPNRLKPEDIPAEAADKKQGEQKTKVEAGQTGGQNAASERAETSPR